MKELFETLRANMQRNAERQARIIHLAERSSGTLRIQRYYSGIAAFMMAMGYFLAWMLANGYYTDSQSFSDRATAGLIVYGLLLLVGAVGAFGLLYVLWYSHKYYVPANKAVREQEGKAPR